MKINVLNGGKITEIVELPELQRQGPKQIRWMCYLWIAAVTIESTREGFVWIVTVHLRSSNGWSQLYTSQSLNCCFRRVVHWGCHPRAFSSQMYNPCDKHNNSGILSKILIGVWSRFLIFVLKFIFKLSNKNKYFKIL